MMCPIQIGQSADLPIPIGYQLLKGFH